MTPPPSKQEKPKSVLITGASSGIGYILAERFFERGYFVIALGRNEEALKSLIAPSHERCTYFVQDLSTTAGQAKLEEIISIFCPDIVINNAGLGFYGETTHEEDKKTIEVNCTALVSSTKAALATWKKTRNRGIVVNVSSAIGFTPAPNMSVYAASKAFVTSFSCAEDFRARSFGCRVLTACPGMVATNFRLRASRGLSSREPDFSFFVMDGAKAADEILCQIDKQKKLHVFDWKTRLLIFFAKILPQKLVDWILFREIQKRNRSD
jgi:uncharacterized protein